jgi:hypothetical protein
MTDRYHLNFPLAVVVNVFLVDVGPENGATELWLGTHHQGVRGLTKSDHVEEPFINEEALEERRKICPPIREFVPKGSIMLRDMRLWHCGVRIMILLLALYYQWRSLSCVFTNNRFISLGGTKIKCGSNFLRA